MVHNLVRYRVGHLADRHGFSWTYHSDDVGLEVHAELVLVSRTDELGVPLDRGPLAEVLAEVCCGRPVLPDGRVQKRPLPVDSVYLVRVGYGSTCHQESVVPLLGQWPDVLAEHRVWRLDDVGLV